MSNKQLTAVDWLLQQFDEEKTPRQWEEVYKQAKELEKQQIESAYNDGYCDEGFLGDSNKSAEQYYKETYEQ